jgi:hypothetical protein
MTLGGLFSILLGIRLERTLDDTGRQKTVATSEMGSLVAFR